MKISTKGRYAVRLMIDLAANEKNGLISLKTVAERQNVSQKYLEHIVKQLTSAGLLKGRRGASGGYTMVKNPEEYTVGEILRAAEGSLAPVACLEDVPNKCEKADSCSTLGIWEGLYDVIANYLDSITIADALKNTCTE